MPSVVASSSDIELSRPRVGGSRPSRAAIPRPPWPATQPSLPPEEDSDGSSTDLEDGARFSYIPTPMRLRSDALQGSGPSTGGPSASSSRSAWSSGPVLAMASDSINSEADVARPAPRHRRSSSSSVVWLAGDDQPVAGPSRVRMTSPQAPRPPPANTSDDDEIQIEGETGPRHRRTGLALSQLVADLRRRTQQRRSPPPPVRRRSSTPPAAPLQAVRFGGAIVRENGVTRHARPSAFQPPARSVLPVVVPAQPARRPHNFIRQGIDAALQGIEDVFVNGRPYRAAGIGGGGEFLHQGVDVPRAGWGQAPPVDQNQHLPLLREQPIYAPPVTAQKLEDDWRAAGAYDPPPPIKTTRGFTRNFEREFGGYLSDSEDDAADVDALFNAGPVAGPSKLGPGAPSEPVVLDLTDDSDGDEIAIVEANGQTSYVTSSTPLGTPPPSVTALVPRKRKAPSVEEEPPNLKLVCPGCNRPLILQAATASRKMHILSCGHLIDGYCLEFLARPPGSEPAEIMAVGPSLSSAKPPLPSAGATRAKGKGRAPPIPRKKTFKWNCPVETCDREHTSDGQPAEGDDGGCEPRYEWKARSGRGGVIPLYA